MVEKKLTVDEFNKFFANVGKKLASKIKNSKWLTARKEVVSVFLADKNKVKKANIIAKIASSS